MSSARVASQRGSGPSRLEVRPSRGVRGRIRVPGDKSISHRALLLAARAEGRSVLHGLSQGDDVRRTAAAVQAFGATLEPISPSSLSVEGGELHEPAQVVDVGNSGTAIRLLAGWAAGLPGLTVLCGDESVSRRPMERITGPLRQMGAALDGREEGRYPPLVVRGGGLRGIDYLLPVPSAQVKGCLLMAGLAAEGETTVREVLPTRAHTEELLALCGADVEVGTGAVTVRASRLSPFELDVPADPSQAAFWVVAACVVPGSEVVLDEVYVGPGRAGFLEVLARMGADVEVEAEDPVRRTATIRARHSALAATEVAGSEVPGLIDEIPVLAVAAAFAEGTTTFADAVELRVKESDRVVSVVAALQALGASACERADGLLVKGSGGRRLPGGCEVEAAGDHRVAMAAAVAALGAAAPVVIRGFGAVETSYPGFEEELLRCS